MRVLYRWVDGPGGGGGFWNGVRREWSSMTFRLCLIDSRGDEGYCDGCGWVGAEGEEQNTMPADRWVCSIILHQDRRLLLLLRGT
jgi:hypothetical protein